MAFKFFPPVKSIFYGDVAAGKEHIKFASNQLAILERQMAVRKPRPAKEGRRVVSPYAGVVVECISSYSRHEIRIFVNVPPRPVFIPTLFKQVSEVRNLLEEILFEVMSLAYKWTWDAGLIPDPPEFTPEEYATRVIEPSCFVGSVSKDGLVLSTPVAIPSITNHSTPYRVTDLSQVRYTGGAGKVSLIMADYFDQADNDLRFTSVSVLGEGGFPSIIFDESLNLGDYPDEIAILGSLVVVEVDASLSLDFQKLYKIVVIRGEGTDSKKAIINYEIYEIDVLTNTWVVSKTGSLYAPGSIYATPLLFIRRHIKVDREGFIGVFSKTNQEATYDYEINTPTHSKYVYRSVCQKYLYSLDTEEFVETDDHAYIAKIVNINTYDYEIVKSNDSIGAGERFSETTDYVIDHWPWGYTWSHNTGYFNEGISVEFFGFTQSALFHSSGESTYSGSSYIPPDKQEYWYSYQVIINGDSFIFDSRRTLVSCQALSYTVEESEKYELYVPWIILTQKRYEGIRLVYPVINGVNGVIEAKNAFICCDNSLKAVFYGQHIKSTVATQTTVDREVPLYSNPDPADEKTYSEWHIQFQSLDFGSFDVTDVVAAKYEETLLTDLTDPELNPPPPEENIAPWLRDPIEYTFLEPFFGIIFYGSTTTTQVEE